MGAAFARRFGEAGAKLGLLDLRADGIEALSTDLTGMGVDNIAIACDVTLAEQCQTQSPV